MHVYMYFYESYTYHWDILQYIGMNYNDLTATSLEMMVYFREIIPFLRA